MEKKAFYLISLIDYLKFYVNVKYHSGNQIDFWFEFSTIDSYELCLLIGQDILLSPNCFMDDLFFRMVTLQFHSQEFIALPIVLSLKVVWLLW